MSVPAFRKFRFTGWNRGMSLPWSALRDRFDATTRAASTPRLYQLLYSGLPSLAPFRTVEELIAYLGEDLGAGLDAKDRLYTQLVLTARGRGPATALAQSILWIGLWPGLSAAFFRRLFCWREEPDELVFEITTAFTRLVARLDFARVKRVVGTLVRSTERDVIQAHLARARDREQRRDLTRDVEAVGKATNASDLSESEAIQLGGLRRLVAERVGDAVLQALIVGEAGPYVAAALGLGPAAARQRLCRARRRLRRALAAASVPT